MSKRLVGVALFVALAVIPHAKAAGTVTAGGSGSWTGLYVGAGIGGKWADTDWTTTCFGTACTTGGFNFFSPDDSSPRTFSTSALRGSGYAGFNWQLQNWVLGVEGDVGFGNKSEVTPGIPGCTTDCGFFTPTPDDIDSASVKVLGDASIRGRAGFLLVPSVLVYGTAGAAFQRVSANLTCSFAGPWCSPPVFSDILSDTRSATLKGWTAGGGLEWMVHDGWLVRGEYRYSDLGHFSPTFFEGTTNAVFTDIHVVTQELTFGIGYKF
jgi:outer membrane immunogenic protein